MKATFTYAPITTAEMLRGAVLGRGAIGRPPCADDRVLDVDTIPAVHADVLRSTRNTVIATTNPASGVISHDICHLARLTTSTTGGPALGRTMSQEEK